LQLSFLAPIKRGKREIIKFRKLGDGGNIKRERGELMVKRKRST
jgi:hypothetical protein